MPCYNGERYLEKALNAFFAQGYPHKKLVVVDGKSSDRSHEIIASFVERGFPMVWDKTPDKGISNAINIGLAHLNEGDIFGYLGADDILMPNILSEVANLFAIAPKLDGVYFDSYSYLCEKNVMTYRECPMVDFSLNNLLKLGTIVGLQNIYLQGSYVVSNKFVEENKYSMDYELYLRLAKKGMTKFTHIPKASTVNFMDGNISSRFAMEGGFETIKYAIQHVGYVPVLWGKVYQLKRAQIRRRIVALIQRVRF
ncbi:MAG: glycosyltransferase [Sideroxydans sp.]|nr:glycosyltransferase [Sideroxydans sp.]